MPSTDPAPAAQDRPLVISRAAVARDWRRARMDYGKMLAVGAVGLCIDFGLFNALLYLGWPAALANVGALVVAGLVTYKGNLELTFRHRRIPNRRTALARFFAVTLVSSVVIEIVVAAASGLDPSLLVLNGVKASITGLAVLVRFVLYREWVFRDVPH